MGEDKRIQAEVHPQQDFLILVFPHELVMQHTCMRNVDAWAVSVFSHILSLEGCHFTC